MNLAVLNSDERIEPSVGDELILKRFGEERGFGTAAVVGVAHIPFALIPANWLAYAHDSACRTYQGLLATMQERHPGFTEKHFVTLLFFQV